MTGRESFLAECEAAYKETLKGVIHSFFIVENKSTCGETWNSGAWFARELGIKYVHMTADDLIPHEGWYEAAVETIEAYSHYSNPEGAIQKFLPCARVLNPDGSVQVQGGWHYEFPDWAETGGGSVPFCRTEDWIDIPNIHYCSDNAYDYAQQYINKKMFVARTAYAFTHHSAPQGRKEITEEERNIYEEWRKSL